MKKKIIIMLSFLGVSMVYAELNYDDPKIEQASMLGRGQCNVCGLCAPEAAKAGSIHAKINKHEKETMAAFKGFLTSSEKKLFKDDGLYGGDLDVLMTKLNKNPKFVRFKKKSEMVRDRLLERMDTQEEACGAKLPKGMHPDILRWGGCVVCSKCAPEAKVLEKLMNAEDKLNKDFQTFINSLYTKT